VKSAGKGFVLGAANVLVIALGIAMMERAGEAGVLVVMIGMIPGVLAGLALGVIAGRMESNGVVARVSALIVPTIGVVIFLGTALGMAELIVVASIPSVVAALLLERWTRKVELPPVPVAQIRVG